MLLILTISWSSNCSHFAFEHSHRVSLALTVWPSTTSSSHHPETSSSPQIPGRRATVPTTSVAWLTSPREGWHPSPTAPSPCQPRHARILRLIIPILQLVRIVGGSSVRGHAVLPILPSLRIWLCVLNHDRHYLHQSHTLTISCHHSHHYLHQSHSQSLPITAVTISTSHTPSQSPPITAVTISTSHTLHNLLPSQPSLSPPVTPFTISSHHSRHYLHQSHTLTISSHHSHNYFLPSQSLLLFICDIFLIINCGFTRGNPSVV